MRRFERSFQTFIYMRKGNHRFSKQPLPFLTMLACLLLINSSLGSTPVSSFEVNIVSWNIQMLPNSLALFSKDLRKKQSVRAPWIIEHCRSKPYDVIVFQEVFDQQIARKLKKQLRDTYPFQVDPKKEKGRLTSNGILMLSRIPMAYVDHTIFPKGAHSDAWSAKGCTLVEVKKEGITFHIAGTHLQAEDSEAAIMHRDVQFAAIRKLMDKNQSDSIPVFVVGDMNTRKSDVVKYPLMLETIGVQNFPLDDEEPYTFDAKNDWNKGQERSQLDYILLQARQTQTNIIEQHIIRPTHLYKGTQMDLADHYGLVAKIEIFN